MNILNIIGYEHRYDRYPIQIYIDAIVTKSYMPISSLLCTMILSSFYDCGIP